MRGHGYKDMVRNIINDGSRINRMVSAIYGIITSISANGRRINAKVTSGNEVRDAIVTLPYGISSSGVDGIPVQVIMSGNMATVVGVVDSNRPDTKPGELIIYTKYGQRIKLLDNGDITLETNGSSIVVGDDISLTTGDRTITLSTIIDHIVS